MLFPRWHACVVMLWQDVTRRSLRIYAQFALLVCQGVGCYFLAYMSSLLIQIVSQTLFDFVDVISWSYDGVRNLSIERTSSPIGIIRFYCFWYAVVCFIQRLDLPGLNAWGHYFNCSRGGFAMIGEVKPRKNQKRKEKKKKGGRKKKTRSCKSLGPCQPTD